MEIISREKKKCDSLTKKALVNADQNYILQVFSLWRFEKLLFLININRILVSIYPVHDYKQMQIQQLTH